MVLHTAAWIVAGRLCALVASCAAALVLVLAPAGAADPTKIGLSLSLTGATAPAGRQVQTGLEIWRDHVNAKGGLLGRPVELVYYDDQANPANAPGIYAKLMGVDKVDLLIGPYSTNVIAAALPAIIQNRRMTIGIFGLGANKEYKYTKYFSMNSQGASPRNYSRGFFQLALQQQPKPARVALVGADVEFSRNALDGARENAKEFGFDVVYERTYPLANTEYATIVRSMQAAAPDVIYAATLPVDTVGLLRASNEVRFKPKLYGGAFLGLLGRNQAATRAADQRTRQQRVLHSGREPAVRRHQGIPGGLSEAGAGARHRPTRLHLSTLCLCRRADSGQGGERNQVAR